MDGWVEKQGTFSAVSKMWQRFFKDETPFAFPFKSSFDLRWCWSRMPTRQHPRLQSSSRSGESNYTQWIGMCRQTWNIIQRQQLGCNPPLIAFSWRYQASTRMLSQVWYRTPILEVFLFLSCWCLGLKKPRTGVATKTWSVWMYLG